LISTFGPSIVHQLANGTDPTKVCQFLGLCPKTQENKQVKLVNTQYDFSINENPVVCTACKLLVQYLDLEIQKNSSEASILNSLKNACKVLPQSIRSDCDSIVTTYGTYIIQFLIQYADPNSVCPALKLC
jgi:saposin